MFKKISAALIAVSIMTVQFSFAVELETKFDAQTKKMEITGKLPEEDALDNWVTIEVINAKNCKGWLISSF